MKLKEGNIDIYNNSAIILNNKTPSFIKSWIIILIFLSIFVIFISFIPFNIYSTYNGLVLNESYINLNLEESDFPINKNNKLYIKDKKYKYKILSIVDSNVLIQVKLNDNININNNIVVVNILKNRITLFKIIKNKIKKGFGL